MDNRLWWNLGKDNIEDKETELVGCALPLSTTGADESFAKVTLGRLVEGPKDERVLVFQII